LQLLQLLLVAFNIRRSTTSDGEMTAATTGDDKWRSMTSTDRWTAEMDIIGQTATGGGRERTSERWSDIAAGPTDVAYITADVNERFRHSGHVSSLLTSSSLRRVARPAPQSTGCEIFTARRRRKVRACRDGLSRWSIASRRLRSQYQHYLHRYSSAPSTQYKLGDRRFSAAGPRLWNDLLPGLRLPGLTFDSFRPALKSHLFGDRSA